MSPCLRTKSLQAKIPSTNPSLPRENIVMKLWLHASVVVLFLATPSFSEEAATTWFDKQTKWHGFDQFHFKIAGAAAYLVVPPQPLEGKPWIWRARFPGYHDEMDRELVTKGFHLAYVDVAGKFGSPQAIETGEAFYQFLTEKRGLSQKASMEGVSRGGLFVYNWAAKHSETVALIYCDTPVCDFRSWPAGQGDGIGSEGAWKQCLAAYGLTEQQAKEFRGLPIDHAELIANAKIPVLHIVSENDRVVPPKENTYVLRDRLKSHGQEMDLIVVPKGTQKSNGHHFQHPEPRSSRRVLFEIWKVSHVSGAS